MAKTNQKFTRNEQKAIQLVQADPAASNYQISRELESLGYTNGDNYLSARLAKSNELALEVTKVRERNFQKLQQDITPVALEVLQDAVTSTKISKQNKFKWIKLALDKSFGDQGNQVAPSPLQVNVDSIQVYIAGRHADLMEDTIDITEDNKVKHD